MAKPTELSPPDPKHEQVKDPSTGRPIDDPVLRLAVKEGHYRLVNGKVQIHWAGLMKNRRTYDRIPKYHPLTEQEAALLHQLREETFVGISRVSEILGYKTLEAGVRFLARKRVPVFRISGKNLVFSGDVVRAIESCRIDTAADWGVWERYLRSSYGWRDRQQRRK